MSPEAFDSAWKTLGKLSERRLGWFSATWLSETGRHYEVPQATTKLRNDTVHNGLLPSRAQAAEIGEWAVGVMMDICEELRTKHRDSILKRDLHNSKLRRARLLAKIAKDPQLRDLQEHSSGASSLFGLNWVKFDRLSFAQLVEKLRGPTISGINPKVMSVYGAVDFHHPPARKQA